MMTEDYQVVTMADPDRMPFMTGPGKSVFLKGELPFVQICPNPQFDYYWGQSEVQRLIPRTADAESPDDRDS